jgi:hypothetical protein
MANLTAALDRVRQAGDDRDENSSPSFDRYESDYEAILLAIDDYCDRVAFEEMTDWLVETTREDDGFPSPEAVRDRARSLSMDQGIIVPANSPLRD